MYQHGAVTQQQHFVAAPPQHFVVLPTVTYGTESQRKIMWSFGITEIVLGAISCVLGLISVIIVAATHNYYHEFYGFTYISQGIWCGAVLISCGVLGIRVRYLPTKCMYNANLAMSIVAANFMGVLVILSAFAAILADRAAVMAFHITIAILGFAAFVIAIIHTAYCCAGICCISRQGRHVMYDSSQIHPQPHVVPVQLPTGQVMYQYQPPSQTASTTVAPTGGNMTMPVNYMAPATNRNDPATAVMPSSSTHEAPTQGYFGPPHFQQQQSPNPQPQAMPGNPPSYAPDDEPLLSAK